MHRHGPDGSHAQDAGAASRVPGATEVHDHLTIQLEVRSRRHAEPAH